MGPSPAAFPNLVHLVFAHFASHLPMSSGGEQLVDPSGFTGPGVAVKRIQVQIKRQTAVRQSVVV
jgi:hypothetical protein